MAPFKDKWIRRFVINETSRHKQGFTIYKVTSMIFLKSSPDTASKVSVWKRYNDFKKLHTELRILHGKLKIKESYPPFPKPKFFGRFEAEVIEERRECAVKFLEFVARHPSLFANDICVKFFETSLRDDACTDCSRSISSDTSEDDKTTIPESLDDAQIITSQKIETPRTSKENGVARVVGEIPANSSIGTKFEESQKCNNNNMLKKSEDTNWQEFLSVEKLLENGKSDSSRSTETLADPCDNFHLSDTIQDPGKDSGHYILIAAAHMSAGFRHEAIAEYEEAFMQYKLGISNLRHGVQKDPDIARTATIRDKIMKYSERADRLYNRHLNCNISMISKPVSELRYYKVVRVIGSVMLVNDIRHQTTRVIKTVEKAAGVQEDISKYILRGRVPYMVQLHACIQTETTVFLILQYASGGRLWDYLKKQYAITHGRISSRRRSHGRSTSCEATIDLTSEKRINTSLERLQREDKDVDKESNTLIRVDAYDSEERRDDYDTTCQESLATFEEELDVTFLYDRDISTTTLLEKAEQLLKSVDATIKKSNSIATRLNESGRLLYENEAKNPAKENEESENTEGSSDQSELSTSNSGTDLSAGSDQTNDKLDNFARASPLRLSTLANRVAEEQRSIRDRTRDHSHLDIDNEHSCYDEDSGIEMEQELWRIPEMILKTWAAQMLLTLEALHQQNVVISDLRPENLLVDENNRILLSYVVPRQNPQLSRCQKPYTAPELCMYLPVEPATPAADVWSFGVVLYELFTGIPFQSRHPGPFHSHSIISIPNELSDTAKSLLTKVLRFDPSERLTITEIKQLPFFEKIDWLGLLNV